MTKEAAVEAKSDKLNEMNEEEAAWRMQLTGRKLLGGERGTHGMRQVSRSCTLSEPEGDPSSSGIDIAATRRLRAAASFSRNGEVIPLASGHGSASKTVPVMAL